MAYRLAESYVTAGIAEPDDRYTLIDRFEKMARNDVAREITLLDKVHEANKRREARKAASGSSRGAMRSPIPAGMGQGQAPRAQRAAAVQNGVGNPDDDVMMYL